MEGSSSFLTAVVASRKKLGQGILLINGRVDLMKTPILAKVTHVAAEANNAEVVAYAVSTSRVSEWI